MDTLISIIKIHNWKFSRTQNETGQRSEERGEWIGSIPMNPELIARAAQDLARITAERDERVAEVGRLNVTLRQTQHERDAMREAIKQALPYLVNCAEHHRDDFVLEDVIIPQITAALKQSS